MCLLGSLWSKNILKFEYNQTWNAFSTLELLPHGIYTTPISAMGSVIGLFPLCMGFY